MADITPWEGKATWLDKTLMFAIFGIPLLYLGLLPLRPFMLANFPITLEFITGARSSIIGAAAYASEGRHSLWLAIFAGFVGMVKFDAVFWLVGWRWGEGITKLFGQNEVQRKRINKFRRMPRWLLFLLTFASHVPGVPGGTLIYIVTGWSKMRLWVFLLASFLGGLSVTIGMALLGYTLGERAVEVIQVIDKYALWISLGLIAVIFVVTLVKNSRQDRQDPGTSAKVLS